MTKVVKIGNVAIGGKNPIRIKGMLKSPLSNVNQVIKEARQLESEGAEAIRIAVHNENAAKLAPKIMRHVNVPLVADIHFHYRLALAAIENGFASVRLNPSNISKKNEILEVVNLAKKYKVSIRVGVNSGGFKENFSSGENLAKAMIGRIRSYIKILESKDFYDIMVSIKAADVNSTIIANRLFCKNFDYPLHLGVTATGPFLEGVVKSSLGVGGLLNDGIGNVIRISLTAPSFWEIRVAKYILQALNLRKFGPEIVSCPTCSRCEVDLIKIVDTFKNKLEKSSVKSPLRIALMGCVVNGPGEASQADIGAAFGKGRAVIFKKGKIVCTSNEKDVMRDLLKRI